MRLLYTGGGVERWVDHAEEKLQAFSNDSGYLYVRHKPTTPANSLFVEDLGVTLLMNSQARWRSAKSLIKRGSEVSLSELPNRPLEETSADEREVVANVIAKVANWPGFASSTATKVLHKKRPDLIPVPGQSRHLRGLPDPHLGSWPSSAICVGEESGSYQIRSRSNPPRPEPPRERGSLEPIERNRNGSYACPAIRHRVVGLLPRSAARNSVMWKQGGVPALVAELFVSGGRHDGPPNERCRVNLGSRNRLHLDDSPEPALGRLDGVVDYLTFLVENGFVSGSTARRTLRAAKVLRKALRKERRWHELALN